jgi:hypothetical protein
MKLFRTRRQVPRGRARQRRVAQGTVLALVVGTLVVLALRHEGSPIRDVELNDGGVWVTNGSRALLGRLNSQVEELDLAVQTSATSNAVFQQGPSVQVYDDGGGADATTRALTLVDVVSGVPLPVSLPDGFAAAAGGGTVAVVDETSGRVWLLGTSELEGFDGSAPADLEVSERSSVVVTRRGTALVADRQAGEVQGWRFDETGTAVLTSTTDIGTTLLDDAEVSAVGERPVVLQGGQLYRPGAGALTVEGDDPVLQQVGEDSSYVHWSTSTGLWRAALDGGQAEEVAGLELDAPAAAPVVVAGCVHGAWRVAGQDNYARVCGDDRTTGEASELTDDAELVFRTNREVVVLNDAFGGASWLVQVPGLPRVDNWDSVDPSAEDPQVAEADDEKQDSNRNKPPTAEPDAFGGRPGATVVLPVTLNDVDPDGDVLVITGPPAAQGGTTFSVVGDGTQIQAKISPDASSTVRFKYEISDGQPGNVPSETTVELKIVGSGTDTPPTLIKDQENELVVADGHQASVNVVPAWIDPEGDAVVLVGATSDAGTVGFRPDGTIDFTDDGSGVGEETVEFTLRGGGRTRTGVLDVSVVEPEKAEPTTVADHASGSVGAAILLEPLANDIDPLGGQLALSSLRNVTEKPARVTRDGDRGTGTFLADQPGAYYLTYEATASNGIPAEPQTIRVDVVPATRTNRNPVATRDIAAVSVGGSALVDVLANDTDPDGDVLVVQGVRVPARYADAVTASLINKRFVRVELDAAPEGGDPVLEYLLSDGEGDQVTGAIAVTVASDGRNRRPIAVDDVVTGRAGTVISIPVLETDKDPDGDRMRVEQRDLYDTDPQKPVVADGSVPIVATGSTIRVLVPDDGTTQLQFGYGARDERQAVGQARVVLNINPDDPEINQKPQPRPIEERTVTGQRIRVGVDAFGSDPDGDPVVFSGVLEPPKLGRVVGSGTDWFDYEPLDDARSTGTDSFKVQVSDQYGLSGVVDVRIGVAAPAVENQAPSALDDDLLMKPGITVRYPVMGNDSDPDGDPLILTEEGLYPAEGTGVGLVDGFVEIRTPDVGADGEKTLAVEYEVSDGLGGVASAQFTTVVRADAPDYAPTTQDDVVTVDQLRGKVTGDTVDVDVLANDGDLDGSREALALAPVDPEDGEVVDRKLRVTLRAENQLVPYRVTDQTDQTSFGFVYIAGTESMPPTLDTDAVPVEVVAGEVERIELADVVVVRPGRTPKIGNATQIRESNGDATPVEKIAFDFVAPRDFHGTASVSLPVIDGQNLQDPDGLESQITVPITVLPAANVPPTIRDTVVTVTADRPATIRLDRLATDPNPDDRLEFTVGGESAGVTADVSAEEITVEAAGDAPSGEVVLSVAVDDGTAPAVEGQLRVVVLGVEPGTEDEEPPAPLMTLRELTVPDAEAGTPVSVDVRTAILRDPFPDAGKEIVTVSATGPAGEPTSAGTTLTVTPNAAGDVVVAYQLSDGSGDPARVVDGRVVITVAAEPDAPGAPVASESGPTSVLLEWQAPLDNGSPILGYTVSWSSGSQPCGQTSCPITGLEAGETYEFRVTARNAVGESEASPQSAPITPNEKPDKMAAPTIADDFADRDGQLTIQWRAGTTKGSEITHYVITSIPAVSIADVPFGETSTPVTGLTNGTGYRFAIQAVNDEDAGDRSTPSEEGVPFTRPSVMGAPVLVASNDDGRSGGYLEVSWPAVTSPEDGYDDVTEYTVELLRDGASQGVFGVGTALSKSFDVENGYEYTARVRATNRAGTSEFSALSAASISWDRSRAVSSIAKVSDCPEGASCRTDPGSYVGRVSFAAPSDTGGYPVTAYRWSTGGRSGVSDGAGTQFDVSFAGVGGGQDVTITPVTEVPGVGATDGTPSAGGGFSPFAKPRPPGATCLEGHYRSVRLCWNGGDGNGRGTDATEYRGSAGGTRGGGGGDVTIGTSQGGDRACVQVRTRTTEGLWSDWTGDLCANAAPREINATVEAVGGNPPGPCTSNCDSVTVHVAGYQSSRSYSYSTNIAASDTGAMVSGSLQTNGDGRASKVVAYYDRTVYDETYCINVDGLQACVRGR